MQNTAALYIRVSTSKQEELSPDAQKRLLIEYAKKNGYEVLADHIYMENGISGKKADKRPEFQKMIVAARNREFDAILVWKFSRFARNQEESIVYKSLLEKNGVNVISISEPIIEGPFGSLIERIIEWFDEFYSINLASEVRRGMTEKALRGGYQSAAPLGYDSVPGKIPMVNEKEAAIVKYIYTSYLEGIDFSSIARKLNEQGHKTKRGYPFELRTVRYILQNPFYIGKVRWNRASHSSHQNHDPDDIIIADGKHEPLISEGDFNDVQKRIESSYTPARRKGVGYSKHYICGLLKCGVCGATMTYYHPENKQGGFQCYKYTKGMHPGSCYISQNNMEKMLLEILDNVDYDTIHFDILPKANMKIDLANFKKQLAYLDKKEKRCKEAYLAEIDTLEEYKENKEAIQKERHEIEQKIFETKMPEDSPLLRRQLMEDCKTVAQLLRSDADSEEKASSLRQIVKEIKYQRESKSLEIIFYKS
ncbi:MAG: recombinase family protein [Lachnospiraceae bacterium]|nr:recombinase family protein [Lachnospiraceae bacterium]